MKVVRRNSVGATTLYYRCPLRPRSIVLFCVRARLLRIAVVANFTVRAVRLLPAAQNRNAVLIRKPKLRQSEKVLQE